MRAQTVTANAPAIPVLAGGVDASYAPPMSTVARELIEIVDALPEEKARAVVDFARFLQNQADDRAWERILSEPRAYPKLDQFVADALREGPIKPLDPGQL